MAIRKIIEQRWFALFDLACVSFGIVLWEIDPSLGWIPLAAALLPWAIRLCAGHFPFQRSQFDIPLLIFLLTAALGVWAAYNKVDAWAKFWLLVGGVLLFYALIGQPQRNRWYIAVFLILFGVGTAGFFLLSNNWLQDPVEIGVVNRLALEWMQIRPDLHLGAISHNSAAGVTAFTAPFLIPLGLQAWREKRGFPFILVLAGGFFLSIGFLLAVSRGALLAFGASLCIGILWAINNHRGNPNPDRRTGVLWGAVILWVILLTGLLITVSGGLTGLGGNDPGSSMGVTRQDLAYSGIQLIQDYPYTGGGLSAFPGQYSTYILETPNFFVSHSHNLFVDLALEQNIAGLLAVCFIFSFSAFQIFRQQWTAPRSWLVWAALFSLMTVAWHGLSDDIIYNGWGIPILFLTPGAAWVMSRSEPQPSRVEPDPRRFSRSRTAILVGVVITACLAGLLVIGKQKSLLASWYANLGAVQMDRVELPNYSDGEWNQDQDLAEFVPAERLFKQALHFDGRNSTANFRLGLIAMHRRDFSRAVSYLEEALRSDQNHRGILKALGFSYVWSGKLREALPLLSRIPEAKDELGVYPWWWRSQGQEILAARAETMKDQLQALP